MPQHNWQRFFNGHAPDYMDNVFTRATAHEVEFLQQVMDIAPGDTILDVGCGTGRHAVALAKLGYRVTGIDLSTGMLAQARAAADRAGVDVTFIQADATRFTLSPAFDAAVCLCEGAFGLIGQGADPLAHDTAILRNIHHALKPGADFTLTALLAFRHLKAFFDEGTPAPPFDPITMVETSTLPVGEGDLVQVHERSYIPTELRMLLTLLGFEVRHIWGGTAGNWGQRPIDLLEMELMLVASKSA